MDKTLLKKKTLFGYDIAEVVGVLLMIIPAIIATTYLSTSKGGFFHKTVKDHPLCPDYLSSIFACVIYVSLIIRYNFFKKDNLGEVLFSTAQTFVNIWVLAAFASPLITGVSNRKEMNPIQLAALISSVLLSWLGMKSIAGYAWIIYFIAAIQSLTKLNAQLGGIGAVFIVLATLSMLLQVKNISSLKDLAEDFRSSASDYTKQIKEEINSAADDAVKKANAAVEMVKRNIPGIGNAVNAVSAGSNVKLDLDSLDVNHDGVIDEKDFAIMKTKKEKEE